MTHTTPPKTLAETYEELSREARTAYEKCPYSFLSRDYFARFTRNPTAQRSSNEIEITSSWKVLIATEAGPVAHRMTKDLIEFFERCMHLELSSSSCPEQELDREPNPAIILKATGGGLPSTPASFSITSSPRSIRIAGRDADGLRDGIAKLVELIGLRQAPFVQIQNQSYTPRLQVRLGFLPWLGSYRDLVFMGYNATLLSDASFFALSTSDAIPGLENRRDPSLISRLAQEARQAQEYGLKTFFRTNTVKKFRADDPIFKLHPDLRGALTWKANGDYILCTSHPLVQQFHRETIEGIFRGIPGLDGISIIIGGEGFYHCFMRAYGVEKGHTNCPRCEAIGPDQTVANLCNFLAESARRINPRAEISVWPYSAGWIWSSDHEQSGLIKHLKPGTIFFSEIEKDETILKDGGISKTMWDYSIEFIGPGQRAKNQIALCKQAGIPIHLKSEPEISLEAPRQPHIPCLDRWLARADALASCGADGAWVFPAFRPNYGTSANDVNRLAWWTPHLPPEDALQQLAAQIAGEQAGPFLRKAWAFASEACALFPEIPVYYKGPYYLGPAHPMCVNPQAELPPVFYGRYLFMAEETEQDGLRLRPTYLKEPSFREPAFGNAYRRMKKILEPAIRELHAADPLVPERHRLTYGAESSSIRWFHHTIRSVANFYDSCDIRDRLPNEKDPAQIKRDLACWLEVLRDEKANSEAALPVMESDVRLDMYYGTDHTFSHGADMIRAKLVILEEEINDLNHRLNLHENGMLSSGK